MKHKLVDLTIERVALVRAGSNPAADIVLFKAKPGEKEPEPMSVLRKTIDLSKLTADEQKAVNAALAKAGADIVETTPTEEQLIKALSPELQAVIEKAKTSPAPPTPEDVLKSLTPEARAIVEKAQKDAADASVRATSAENIAKEERSKREQGDFVKANDGVLKQFPGKTDDTGSLLFRIKAAIPPADFAALDVLIKAGGEALRLQKEEAGEAGDPMGNSGYTKLKGAAEELRKNNPKWTVEKAFAKASEEHPDWVAEYREESRSPRG